MSTDKKTIYYFVGLAGAGISPWRPFISAEYWQIDEQKASGGDVLIQEAFDMPERWCAFQINRKNIAIVDGEQMEGKRQNGQRICFGNDIYPIERPRVPDIVRKNAAMRSFAVETRNNFWLALNKGDKVYSADTCALIFELSENDGSPIYHPRTPPAPASQSSKERPPEEKILEQINKDCLLEFIGQEICSNLGSASHVIPTDQSCILSDAALKEIRLKRKERTRVILSL